MWSCWSLIGRLPRWRIGGCSSDIMDVGEIEYSGWSENKPLIGQYFMNSQPEHWRKTNLSFATRNIGTMLQAGKIWM